ncbi:putative ABC transporter ATP-binding protein [Meiothermus luteus]|uniref:Putative ABC transporter ATP-binding protein n=1 Tax=Meiothermus luteus TaxID=2026184 RepID=A0A399EP44_9DEIN|nr:ABC transporter ATP-binding protein [Meiothermus luteus]RIH84252.1 putative ABC transporter ATP-binding protein [Meiothermus luteus]RIH84262.1 putative ABC transporter ATP-binding protein [Meiothermus luteus]
MFSALRHIFRAAPGESVLLLGLLALGGLVPVAVLGLTRLLVDNLAATLGSGAFTPALLWPLAGLALAFSLDFFLTPWVAYLQGSVNEKLTARVHVLLMEKVGRTPDLTPFEDPSFHDTLQVLRDQAPYQPLNLLVFLGNAFRGGLTVAGVLFLLFTLAPFFPLLLLLATLPQALLTFRLQKGVWEALLFGAPEARRMRYFAEVLLTPEAAKEVRLFGLLPFFRGRYLEAFQSLYQTLRRARTRQALGASLLVLLSALFTALALFLGLRQALLGAGGLGSLVLLLQSVGSLQQNLYGLVQDAGMLYESLLYFERLEGFLAAPSAVEEKASARPVAPFTEIRFEGVGFCYPDGRRALEGLSFALRKGERLALVGENGAGKTTLVKLLLRFYDPTEGRILVDGVDLRELDLKAWRACIAAVFQDFGRYALTLKENILLSDPAGPHDPARLEEAARAGGAWELVETLGWEALLSRSFGGTELSLGQWQRVALARAFFRRAELLVLDEPTASLDPKEEAHLYRRFAELTRGKTMLLITHRLGSVQMADRILVLHQGRLVEEGTHEALLGWGGIYAELWRSQAGLYQPG